MSASARAHFSIDDIINDTTTAGSTVRNALQALINGDGIYVNAPGAREQIRVLKEYFGKTTRPARAIAIYTGK